jgi:hypothetical protein
MRPPPPIFRQPKTKISIQWNVKVDFL